MLGLGLQARWPHCTMQKMFTLQALGLRSLLPISALYRNPSKSLYSSPSQAMYLSHLGVTPELNNVHIVPLYLMKENVSSLAHGVWNFMRLPAKLAGKYTDTLTSKKNVLWFFQKVVKIPQNLIWLVSMKTQGMGSMLIRCINPGVIVATMSSYDAATVPTCLPPPTTWGGTLSTAPPRPSPPQLHGPPYIYW